MGSPCAVLKENFEFLKNEHPDLGPGHDHKIGPNRLENGDVLVVQRFYCGIHLFWRIVAMGSTLMGIVEACFYFERYGPPEKLAFCRWSLKVCARRLIKALYLSDGRDVTIPLQLQKYARGEWR